MIRLAEIVIPISSAKRQKRKKKHFQPSSSLSLSLSFYIYIYRMWSAALLRFIRRRIVLAVIFCMSLTYFLISLIQNVRNSPQILIIMFNIFYFFQGVSLESDDFEIKRERPLIWRTHLDRQQNFTNSTKCRNSIQGIKLLVDDRGVVCSRSDLISSSGCCDPAAESSAMFNCETCSETHHCCSIYEHCVSCCLNPDKV